MSKLAQTMIHFKVISLIANKFASKRFLFQEKNPIKQVASIVKSGNVKNIVVLSGAGISTASGIPDFRTPGTGLYDNLMKYNLKKAEDIFDLAYFRLNPLPFFDLAREFLGKDYRSTTAHYFIKLLESKGLLLRNYSQNIDGLEQKASIADEKIVYAHGTYTTLTCISCHKKYKDNSLLFKHVVYSEKLTVPKCDQCANGILKPDVVFFGEALPLRFQICLEQDLPKCDMLFVMGTSLAVFPVSMLVDMVPQGTPRVLINAEKRGSFAIHNPIHDDYYLSGDIQESVLKLIEKMGWTNELRAMQEQ